MKLSYRLIKMSCLIAVVSLFLSILLTFCMDQTKLTEFICNVSLNVFAGAIILFSTSLIEYFVNRRKDMEAIMKFLLKYRNYFAKVEYLSEANYLTYDEYKRKFKKKDTSLKTLLKVSDECNEYNKKLFNNFDEIIETYLNISKINLNDFWSIYDDIRFIFNNNKQKLRLHKEIFKKIYDEVNNIRELSYHLNIYKTKGANPIVMYEKIREYQTNIFYEKVIPNANKLDDENMELIKKGIAYSINYNKNSSVFIYNKFTKYLDDKYVDIGKMAYFNKEYTGYEED